MSGSMGGIWTYAYEPIIRFSGIGLVRRPEGMDTAPGSRPALPPGCPRTRHAAANAHPGAASPYGLVPVVCAAAGGRFISTNPDRSRCLTSRSAVIRAIASSAW